MEGVDETGTKDSSDGRIGTTHVISHRDLCLPRLRPIQSLTLLQQSPPGSTVDRAVDSSSAQEGFVRGIDDRVRLDTNGQSSLSPKSSVVRRTLSLVMSPEAHISRQSEVGSTQLRREGAAWPRR